MDSDISFAVAAEFDKLHARIDKLIADNHLQEKDETEETQQDFSSFNPALAGEGA